MDKMFKILNTFTEEAQNASIKKCKELSFDVNRGVISLHESFINLNSAKSLLLDAIEHQKLIQLPISIQNNLLKIIESISTSLTNLTGGTDEIDNLVNAIERLNTSIWEYGIHNLSDEILGYQTKLNQLKNLELEVNKLKEELKDGLNIKSDLEGLVDQGEKTSESLQATLGKSEENAHSVADILTKTTEIDQQIAAKLATIQQNEDASTKHLAITKTSSAEVTALDAKIKEFYEGIDQYKDKMTTTSEDAKKNVNDNKAATDVLISTLQELENQIKDQLQKATGHSLFHSFQKRKETLVVSKWIWSGALLLLLCCAALWSYWLSSNTAQLDTAFYLRLSLSLPLIFAITFCATQYSHERKLEEEYAFKSNISISLIPYKELVEKIISTEKPEEKEKYASFIIESINNVFTSPTGKVFDHKENQKGLSDKALKQLISIIEPILKTQG